MSREDEFYQEARKRGSTSVDEHSKFGTGGGNVTHSFGKVVSIAGKFGMRTEEIPILLHLARLWHQKSVDDLGHKYEQMVPGYEIKEKIMRNIVCMFDSGYTLPQGREVINYYYPLEYGFDRLLETAQEKKASVAGRPDGDGLAGMNRLSISGRGPGKPSPGTGNRAGYNAFCQWAKECHFSFAIPLEKDVGLASIIPLAHSFDNDEDGVLTALILADIGGMVGLNATRRYKVGQPMTALINYQDGKPSFNFPRISISPAPFRPGSSCMSIGLVNVEW